ncbi:hydrophobin-like protein [Heterobasidion irregulare TC 32-1]|uniref:Hydrophobin n=1 Tax=Heterobasidion irregulare (strain TC 32-1) TaxID=747525 RepID=W4K4P7_HETIT|nr:hydrophobin-like protein [Heterobasidion irregulare TC 32-1]ETW80325.1 hydrophobin-like protein [Heterobasidion irregulare TC 32-1]
MFARISSISAVFFLGFALMVSATPTPSPEMLAARGGQCNTGPLQCCNSVQQADAPGAAQLLKTLGVVVQGTTTMVGINCSPIPILGAATGTKCTQQPVCCENNNYNGLVNIGCSPINGDL